MNDKKNKNKNGKRVDQNAPVRLRRPPGTYFLFPPPDTLKSQYNLMVCLQGLHEEKMGHLQNRRPAGQLAPCGHNRCHEHQRRHGLSTRVSMQHKKTGSYYYWYNGDATACPPPTLARAYSRGGPISPSIDAASGPRRPYSSPSAG